MDGVVRLVPTCDSVPTGAEDIVSIDALAAIAAFQQGSDSLRSMIDEDGYMSEKQIKGASDWGKKATDQAGIILIPIDRAAPAVKARPLASNGDITFAWEPGT